MMPTPTLEALEASPPPPVLHLTGPVSEISPPTRTDKTHRPHHHLPHPHFHRRDRDKEDKAPQSAHPNLQPNTLEWSKSEGPTPDGSRTVSRNPSIRGLQDEAAGMARIQVTDAEVKQEKDRNALRATELSNSLMELDTLSNDTTRRLDTTYYSVLEKLSALQNTIASLKELTLMSRRLNVEFSTESEEVMGDLEEQMDAFENFQQQQQKIEALQLRITHGRKEVQVLGKRVEVVQDKVTAWAKLELVWQEKMRRRLKLAWGIITVIGVVLLGLLIFQYTPARTQGPGVLHGLNASSLKVDIPELEGKFLNETLRFKRSVEYSIQSLKSSQNETLEEDPRLRAFDEL